MLSQVVVHPDQASFDAWAKEGLEADASLVEVGKKVFQQRGCVACHSVDGARRVGPTLKGAWGHEVNHADGSTATFDEEYLRESVQKPAARVVAGFPNVMPPSALPERDLKALAAYLQTLGARP